MNGVRSVIWLPRSKHHDNGGYPYRLWCTFESISVQQRGLQVAVAGVGLSHFQKRVRLLGSWAPALFVTDGTLNKLVWLNFWAYPDMSAFSVTLH